MVSWSCLSHAQACRVCVSVMKFCNGLSGVCSKLTHGNRYTVTGNRVSEYRMADVNEAREQGVRSTWQSQQPTEEKEMDDCMFNYQRYAAMRSRLNSALFSPPDGIFMFTPMSGNDRV